MKFFRKIDTFKLSFTLIFIYILQKQFFNLLKIDLVSTLTPSISIIELLFAIALLPIVLYVIYYLPALFIIKLSKPIWITFKNMNIEYKELKLLVYLNFKIKNKSNILCVYRC